MQQKNIPVVRAKKKRISFEQWMEEHGQDAVYVANKLLDRVADTVDGLQGLTVETNEAEAMDAILYYLYETSLTAEKRLTYS
jgi:hypothetical protein